MALNDHSEPAKERLFQMRGATHKNCRAAISRFYVEERSISPLRWIAAVELVCSLIAQQSSQITGLTSPESLVANDGKFVFDTMSNS